MENNVLITKISEYDKKKGKGFSFSIQGIEEWLLASQKLKIKDKVIFFRLLATMVNAGIPVLKSIKILEKQESNPLLKAFYTYLIGTLTEGKNLSNSLRDYRQNFSDSECSIIESGEKTGKFNTSLVQLADQTEKVASISSKLKGAMIYPIAVSLVMFASITVLMVMVVPKLLEIFGDKGNLPALTQVLIGVSNFFVNYMYIVILLIIASLIGLKLWYKTELGKFKLDGYTLKIPIFGPILKKVILSKFTRVFSNLISSGISIVESFRIVADVVGNEVYKQRILLLREDIKRGIKIGESLEDDPLFPEMLIQMIKVGEETAKLDSIILKIADFYDEEVEQSINTIQKLLEPVIIVTMGIVIGFIGAGIMQPIMNLADTISQT